MADTTLLTQTRAFWDANPCDAQGDIMERMRFRYRKEPWLPQVLDRIATFDAVLEVGCGQGTDALYVCDHMQTGSRYVALDYSPQSLAKAREASAVMHNRLAVKPELVHGNAEHLKFADNSFPCVASLGVLHHSPDTQAAVNEVYRVLKPGGTAIITLYRLWSPKLVAAYMLRFFSRTMLAPLVSVDRQCNWMRNNSVLASTFGTMFHECVGVPVLRSYTVRGLRKLFAAFSIEVLTPVGFGLALPRTLQGFDHETHNPLGAQWLIVARKP